MKKLLLLIVLVVVSTTLVAEKDNYANDERHGGIPPRHLWAQCFSEIPEAFNWCIRKKAEGCYKVAEDYILGVCLRPNKRKSAKFARKACKLGLKKACVKPKKKGGKHGK